MTRTVNVCDSNGPAGIDSSTTLVREAGGGGAGAGHWHRRWHRSSINCNNSVVSDSYNWSNVVL